LTGWVVLGGPIIGHYFVQKGALTLIIGDECRPKYFGAWKLTLRIGETRELQFFWQESYTEYITTCFAKGLFYIQNFEKLDWIDVLKNKVAAVVNPSPNNIYSSIVYLTMTYKGATKILKFSTFLLYSIPEPAITTNFPLITSNFTTPLDHWITANSNFLFSDNWYDQ